MRLTITHALEPCQLLRLRGGGRKERAFAFARDAQLDREVVFKAAVGKRAFASRCEPKVLTSAAPINSARRMRCRAVAVLPTGGERPWHKAEESEFPVRESREIGKEPPLAVARIVLNHVFRNGWRLAVSSEAKRHDRFFQGGTGTRLACGTPKYSLSLYQPNGVKSWPRTVRANTIFS
jgi:hypothetical protein